MLVARVDGVADREAAAALTAFRLFVPRDRLPAPEEDEFYRADLVGLAVADQAGETLGTVTAVLDYGAGDILEIARPGGGVRDAALHARFRAGRGHRRRGASSPNRRPIFVERSASPARRAGSADGEPKRKSAKIHAQ